MSLNGTGSTFIPFTLSGLTTITTSNSNIGDATATSLTMTAATPNKIARFNGSQQLVSASVDTTDLVPYVGATTDLNLGSYTVTAQSITGTQIFLNTTAPTPARVAGYNGTGLNYLATPATYLTNLTSDPQTQINAKFNSSGGTITGNVTLTGTNQITQAYNALVGDTTTLVNRTTLDSAIAALGAGVLNLNNTWTGTNTFNNILTSGSGYTTSLNNIFSTINNNSGQTAANLTTAGMPSTAPAGSVLSGAYQLTAGAATGVMGMWLGSYTHQSGNTTNFTFTSMRGSQTLALSVYQYNTAGTSSVSIGDNVYSITTSSQTITGSFTSNKYASYTGSIIFFFQALAVGQNVQFTTFSMTNGSTNINGKEFIASASAGALTVGSLGGAYSAQGVGTIGQFTINTSYSGIPAIVINAADAPNSNTYYWKMESFVQGSGLVGYKASVYNNGSSYLSLCYGADGKIGIGTSAANPVSGYTIQLGVAGTTIGTAFAANGLDGSGSYAQYRAVYGNYGFMIRNDGSDTYFLLTNSGDQYGSWNSFRPFRIQNSTGKVFLCNTDEALQIGNTGSQATSIIGSLYVYNKITSDNGYYAYNNRAIKAKDITAQSVNFYFGSWGNDTNSDWADCIGLNTWIDGGGGSTNILMVNKNRFGIRQYQQAFGTNSAMTSYNDCCMKGSGDSSFTKFGPNATWNSYLAVGACTNQINSYTAQVICTAGNLHLDAANSTSMYYGFYAWNNGLPNTHRFYGSDILFASGLSNNASSTSQVVVLNGTALQKSQCVVHEIYNSNSISWGAGLNVTNAFYVYNSYVSILLTGKYSGYWSSGGLGEILVRLYSQSTGVYFYFYIRNYQNNSGLQITLPLSLILSLGGTTGWFDLYIANSALILTDANNQLVINVILLPVNGF